MTTVVSSVFIGRTCITSFLPAQRYFFGNIHTPSVLWTDLGKFCFKAGAPMLRLDLLGDRILSGEVPKEYKPAEPFKWLAPHA